MKSQTEYSGIGNGAIRPLDAVSPQLFTKALVDNLVHTTVIQCTVRALD